MGYGKGDKLVADHPFFGGVETALVKHLEHCWFYGHLDEEQKAMYNWDTHCMFRIKEGIDYYDSWYQQEASSQ